MRQTIKQLNQAIAWHNFLPTLTQWVIDEGIRIQQIPAPTFAEKQRAEYVLSQFVAMGLQETYIDEQYNVYGVLKGKHAGSGLMMMAHTDTVFPIETDLRIQRIGDEIIYGAGIGDNSLGVAGILGFLKYLCESSHTPTCDVWFVATSCEEGLGDLNGVKKAYQRLQDKIGVVINIEGLAFGHVYHAGISVHRLHITAQTEGGHSWLHFGRPNAIHVLMQLGNKITQLTPSVNPRSTFNIGVVEGGQSINSIASEAGFWLDLRSENQGELEKLKSAVQKLIKDSESDGVKIRAEVVGSRPSGYIDPKHVLIQGALGALEEVGTRGTLESGSTDGNIPLYHGCPTVTIGITRGGNAHRTDEFMEVAPVKHGMQQLILLALATLDAHSQHKISGV
jgi:acetylornithine deacetylase/succinyl-diaminopimelate desuccinylase-like protein